MKPIIFVIVLLVFTSCNRGNGFWGCKICPGNKSRSEVRLAKKNDKKLSREAARKARKEKI